MADSATQNTSTDLYHYLCQNIVGTEEHVKSIRMMNTVRNNLQNNKRNAMIVSGSFGEGLQMRGSDIDIMTVLKYIEVCEDTNIDLNAAKTYVIMEMKDTQPGFSMLRLLHTGIEDIFQVCDKIDNEFYISNLLFKHKMSNASSSYNILGISFQLVGDLESAKQAFMQAESIYREFL
ncbi:unnamed protein product [Mytilus edulis]|uniref:Uncharacterized protein n=1 Tax=Mytilus edulis TaxID=6550 RepID=A0A8S3TZY2_MYTED|nr:unnamed protein product [Mytilus edulis]